jgi:predicted RNase H-like HicB family nuclease
MMNTYKYEIIIYWSADDNAFIAEVPELPGCMAHGESHEAALGNIKTAIEFWIQTAMEANEPIPRPKCRRLVHA